MANDGFKFPDDEAVFELKASDGIMLVEISMKPIPKDAVVASEILGITLTKRANGQGKSVEMAGFPHHALDTYFAETDTCR